MQEELIKELQLIRLQLAELARGVSLLLGQFFNLEGADETEEPLSIENPIEQELQGEEDSEDSEEEEPQLELPDEKGDEPDKFYHHPPSYIG